MVHETIRILGIDPGFGRMGWGVIEGHGQTWAYVAHGCVETSPKKEFLERLQDIHKELEHIIQTYSPDKSAVENLFFSKNVKTAMQVGEARGVILLTLFEAGLFVFEATPSKVKQAITGYGNADKKQVQKLVQMSLKMKQTPTQDDAADALAIALTCALIHRQ